MKEIIITTVKVILVGLFAFACFYLPYTHMTQTIASMEDKMIQKKAGIENIRMLYESAGEGAEANAYVAEFLSRNPNPTELEISSAKNDVDSIRKAEETKAIIKDAREKAERGTP